MNFDSSTGKKVSLSKLFNQPVKGSDGKIMVWRSTMEEYHPKCTVPTVKHNGASGMVWTCFSRSGVGN